MARIPKQRVIFDAEKYDLDYLRETRDSYSPMTDAEFEDSISYDMGEDDLLDLMEMDWRSTSRIGTGSRRSSPIGSRGTPKARRAMRAPRPAR